jgi:hypothetical protein
MLRGGASGGAAAERRCRCDGRGRGSRVRPWERVDEEDDGRERWEVIAETRRRMIMSRRRHSEEKITDRPTLIGQVTCRLPRAKALFLNRQASSPDPSINRSSREFLKRQ